MARYAVISAGAVENIIECDAEFAAGIVAVPAGDAHIGDLWDGSAFSRPPAPPAPVPQSVSMAQGLIALDRAGITEVVIEDMIAAMPEGSAKREASIWFRRSNDMHRRHPAVLTLAGLLGLTDEQVDDLFRSAAGV
jgi:hypothetical protein